MHRVEVYLSKLGQHGHICRPRDIADKSGQMWAKTFDNNRFIDFMPQF